MRFTTPIDEPVGQNRHQNRLTANELTKANATKEKANIKAESGLE
jgi:hypothetical protein